jgi:hypothetical protein
MITTTDALLSLRPGAEWTITEDGLVWHDTNQTQPTEKEISDEIIRLQADYDSKQYQRSRVAEYPDFRDYLDGVVKGDQNQIDAYIAACQAVKAKYPKGA